MSGGWALDAWVRSDGGRLLCGGAPARLTRLSEAGAAALDRLLAGEGTDWATVALATRLEEAGMLHPVPPSPPPPAALTTVIPVRDGGPELAELVRRLAAGGKVIVVDDGSADGSPAEAAAAGARVVANEGRPGPAGARNTGLRAAEGELVALLDADCLAQPGWADPLAWLLHRDPGLALVAPRVRSAPGDSALGRYETAHSPLDLRADRDLVGPGRRIGFLPAAALVARREALLGISGFDEARRWGEDVDLVLRLLEAGWSARYEPAAEVLHRPRPDLGGMLRQRFAYGSSAAPLDARHPGAIAPLRLSRHQVAVLATTAVGAVARGPLAGAGLGAIAAGGSALVAGRRGPDPTSRRALAGAALRGHANAAGRLAGVLARDWLPLSGAAGLRSPMASALLAAAVVIDAACAARPGAQPQSPVIRLALRGADNLAYAAGLWRGLLAQRSAAALLPRPTPRAGARWSSRPMGRPRSPATQA